MPSFVCSVAKSGLGPCDARYLAQAISFSISIRSLSLAGNKKLTDGGYDMKGMNAIADMVIASVSLTSLDLSSCNLTGYGRDMTIIKTLADALRVSAEVKILNLLSNYIDQDGYDMLVSAAEDAGILTLCGFEEGESKADLSGQQLGSIDAGVIGRELTIGFGSSLTSLNLSTCKLMRGKRIEWLVGQFDDHYKTDRAGIGAIAAGLGASTSLTKLAIWDNNIGAEGATAIVNAAPAHMRTVCGDMFEEGQTEADLSDKKLGPEGAILVAWDLRAGFIHDSLTSLK